MSITVKHLASEYMILLEDVESFSSKLASNGSNTKISLQMKNRADSRDFISFSEILVHDEDGSVHYEKISDLAHLTELIDREKRYYARKELV